MSSKIPHQNFEDESLSDKDKLLQTEDPSIPTAPRRVSTIFFRDRTALLTHAIIFFVYLATTLLLVASNIRLRRPTIIITPANEAVKWKVTKWHSGDSLGTAFTGEPRPELEDAWNGLLGKMNLRLSLADIKAFNHEETAIALPDGSGYLGTLNVYHEIHCVRWLQKYIHQEHYFPGLDEEGKRMNLRHSEHCINTLRQFATCHGDVGLITYSWSPVTPKPQANGTVHQCIDWERLAEWTNERTIDMFEPGLLIHPSLGPAYPDGEPARPE